ncbi:MAG: hypothetical protein U0441_04680 [Polyangiaceae bacterium]
MPPVSDRPAESRPPATRADVLGAAAILVGTAALVLGPRVVARLSAHPSAAECDALLTRYVELKERAVSDKIDPKHFAESLEDARRLAGPTFAACTTEVTLEEAECARKAGYADELLLLSERRSEIM